MPTLDPASPTVLKVPEIAALLRVDQKTVRDIIARGELPAIRLGRRGLVRVARAVLDRYLEGRAAPEDTTCR
jgi:excisionase family DNA binding protein